MKNLFYLIIISLFIFPVSCKKDKEVKNENNSIVGQWIITTEKVEEYNKETKLREYTNTNVGKVTFRSDGTFTVTGPNGEEPESGSYKIDAVAKTISLKYEHDTQFASSPILELTASKMVIRIEVKYDTPYMGVDREISTLTLIK